MDKTAENGLVESPPLVHRSLNRGIQLDVVSIGIRGTCGSQSMEGTWALLSKTSIQPAQPSILQLASMILKNSCQLIWMSPSLPSNSI
ncbi:hypothetical protein BCR33DRAFT_711612 [Rhizoclosmatium globosum]|uniref:Uncharacterized protein n=1 Tax=Rhizoclosmatium globosum TaxID=329046 RepID=A0A1Y2D3Z4_9FUNG|nr:hypothetical protein BCR33DRAFT_711612 [Rhizoclosmatium globosum]|eukprot:ORY53295.1 hypothetical protein BCR33DRAFT_711612 [Rhizoclosmatium globosum]